jgi:hypothetical protein
MHVNLLWTGREYYSLENCLITSKDTGNSITSTIVGSYQNKIYTVEYFLETDNKWLTRLVNLTCKINNKEYNLELKRGINNSWVLNDEINNDFDNCLYVDISVTPFTNTLPVNHLQLALNEKRTIKAIYINVLEQEIKAVEQVYQKLSDAKYLYQNVPNDFEAIIEFDESGFVVDYPNLFYRTAVLKS